MYLIFYLYIVIISSIILCLKTKRVKKSYIFKFIIISIMFGFFSVSLGSDILIDRESYNYMFNYRFPLYHNTLESIFNTTIEPGYIILNLIINKFTNNSMWLYFLITFFNVFIDIYVLNKIEEKNKKVIIYYLISIQIFFGTYLCRQIITTSIINLAFLLFIKEKKVGAVFLTLLAIQFHKSAVIFIFILIIMNMFKDDTKDIRWFLGIGFFIFIFYEPIIKIIFNLPILGKVLLKYNSEINFVGNYSIILKGLPYHFITICAIKEYKNIKIMLKNTNIYIVATIFNSMFWILASKIYWMYRMSMYVMVPTLVLIPYILKSCKNRSKRTIYFYTILGSMLLITLREIIITI